MTQNVFSNQSVHQLENLFRQVGTASRHATRIQLGELPVDEFTKVAPGGQIFYGKPTAAHGSGLAIDYDLYDRSGVSLSDTLSDVYNGTGQELNSAVLHFIFETEGGYLAFPAELEPCTQSNPVI